MLANRFADFFHEKMSTIRQDLQASLSSVDQTPYPDEMCFAEPCIFDAVTREEVKAFASKSISKSCILVPLPSHIINGCFDTLLPIVTSIVNLSHATRIMPESLKLAELRSSLKKPDADHGDYASFRPTSNLPKVSKVVEKPAGH